MPLQTEILNEICYNFALNDEAEDKINAANILKQNASDNSVFEHLRQIAFQYYYDFNKKDDLLFSQFLYYGPSKGLTTYSLKLISLLDKITPTQRIEVIDGFIEVLESFDYIETPTFKQLKITKAKNIVGLVSEFIGIEPFIGNPLSIMIVPFSNKKFNSFYDNNTRSIISFKSNPTYANPNYVLAHEFGHVLHYAILKLGNSAPSSFKTFITRYFAPKDEYEMTELFCDSFSIAILTDSEFENDNPYIKQFGPQVCFAIRAYFQTLFSDMKANPISIGTSVRLTSTRSRS